MFAQIKDALIRALHIGEDEAHALATALEADLKPMFDGLREQILTDRTGVVATLKIDGQQLAQDVANALNAQQQPTKAATPGATQQV
ncbi:hypothetical protein [Streptantibioticus silvisoli]|uniref:Uncharacterized protein n=1 Tax=Streptantibioticus silvisoli TaxID=2705255 RepID=A0ABT6W6Y3_9ACTN|nr:hypothetical protein [Streptantibioticus silvisoli]MDI5965732.1 hypothetical protein [Streptantibioticus silvisoli]